MKPSCSHGSVSPHTIGGNTYFNYDVAMGCDEWAVERGLYTGLLKLELLIEPRRMNDIEDAELPKSG